MEGEWQDLAKQFESGMRDEAVRAARRNLQQPDDSDWRWLAEALGDDRQKWFVAAIFGNYPVSKRLFEPFLNAAINEANPSANRQFVEPCTRRIYSLSLRWMEDFVMFWQLVPPKLPTIRFLFVRSWLCSALSSDEASRPRPCASLVE